MNIRLLALAAAAGFAVSGGAQGAVSVLGGGMAEACAKAAIAGRSDPPSMSECDTALDSEVLAPSDRAGTLINRGVMKMRRGAFEAAHVDFDAGIAMAPKMGEGWMNRGAMFVGEKRYKEGLADIDRGLALGVKEPEKAYFNRALAYEGLDDEKSAWLDFKEAETLKPGWALPQRELLRFTVTRR
ncbi:MAG: tetratricopeptide repeat protein [Caulobacteraceae bacterium]